MGNLISKLLNFMNSFLKKYYLILVAAVFALGIFLFVVLSGSKNEFTYTNYNIEEVEFTGIEASENEDLYITVEDAGSVVKYSITNQTREEVYPYSEVFYYDGDWQRANTLICGICGSDIIDCLESLAYEAIAPNGKVDLVWDKTIRYCDASGDVVIEMAGKGLYKVSSWISNKEYYRYFEIK